MNDATITPDSSSIGQRIESVSEAVVGAVADAKGVSTLDVRPPLYEAVEPDALDELVSSLPSLNRESTGFVTFPYSGYDVTVFAGGEVSVAEVEP